MKVNKVINITAKPSAEVEQSPSPNLNGCIWNNSQNISYSPQLTYGSSSRIMIQAMNIWNTSYMTKLTTD